jgi:hypothetical protein
VAKQEVLPIRPHDVTVTRVGVEDFVTTKRDMGGSKIVIYGQLYFNEKFTCVKTLFYGLSNLVIKLCHHCLT